MSLTVGERAGSLRPARTLLAPGLEIARIVTGLWQVADMERGGSPLDPVRGAAELAAYAQQGFDTFDMADHYGSAEVITGTLLASGTHPGVRALTKWCPPPGVVNAAAVRSGVQALWTGCKPRVSTSCNSTGGRLSTPATSMLCWSWLSCSKRA